MSSITSAISPPPAVRATRTPRCVSVLADVPQTFLGHTVQAQRNLFGKRIRDVLGREFRRDAVLLGEGEAFTRQGRGQPEVFDDCGV